MIIWVIVGGLGTLIGPMLGAIALGCVEARCSASRPLIDNSLVLGADPDPRGAAASRAAVVPALQRAVARGACARRRRRAAPGARHPPAPPRRGRTPNAMSEPVVETQRSDDALRRRARRSTTSTSRCSERELRCLIGPNGAGKSTFFKCLTGQYPR